MIATINELSEILNGIVPMVLFIAFATFLSVVIIMTFCVGTYSLFLLKKIKMYIKNRGEK
jgi:hypothetical protein